MKVFYSDHFVLPLPQGHRFPMVKYSMLRERVAAAGICEPGEMRVPHPVSDEEILRAHERGYLRRVVDGTLTRREMRRIGFPWSERMVERSRRASGGTLGACLAALEDGFSANLAGGTHHAFADQGEGYCVFNDSAIAARAVRAEGLVEQVVILDTDVHQGNGTAAILRGDPSIFTFYLAGADPYEDDRLGRLSVSKEGLAERDRLVLESCRERDIPVAVTMAGGYARKVEDTVDIHFRSIERAASLVNKRARA